MNPKLRAKIYTALTNAIEGCVDECPSGAPEYWNEYLHPNLISQMTDAACLVFDASQDAQAYRMKEEQILTL